MKFIITASFLFIFLTVKAQKPYVKLFIDSSLSFTKMEFNNDTIDYSNRSSYYQYASKLLKKISSSDSINKAGQIFDRIYRIDTASEIGINALARRTEIEMLLISKVKNALWGTWEEIECMDAWGENEKTVGRKLNSQVAFSLKKIKLLSKNENKEILYEMRYYFNWEFPSITILIAVEKSDKNWALNPHFKKGKFLIDSITLQKTFLQSHGESKCYTFINKSY